MKNIKYMILMLVVLLLPISAKAEVIQFNVCFGDKGAYSISYDNKVNTEVSKDKITSAIVDDNHLPYPEGISEADKKKYDFTAVSLFKNCYVEGNEIMSCPTVEHLSKYDVIDTYLSNTGVTDLISFKFNQTNGTFNVAIKDKYSDQLSVRYVHGSMVSNAKDELNASNFSGQFLSRSSNGYYSISNVEEKTKIILEFYIKGSGNCSGAYIGYISFYTPDPYDYVVNNPVLNSSKCAEVKKYTPSGMVNSEDLKKFNDVKKNYISECYASTVKYGERSTPKMVGEKLTKLAEMFSGYGSTNVVGNNTCTNNYSVNNKISYLETGNYWSIKCVESYTASGDTPKLVNAGSGFSYQANYSVTRTCTITQINKPTRGTGCSYDLDSTCSWFTKTGTENGQDAGPTEDFDNCIYSCDGGKYTQKCINACYSDVYENGRNIGFLNKENKYTQFVATYTGPNTGNHCTTDHGRSGQQVCHTYHGITKCACFSTWCGNHGGQCTFYEIKIPSGCVDNPDAAYQAALNNSEAELRRFALIQESFISKEEDEYTDYYKYEITDSHLKTKDGKPYVFTVNSKDNPAVNVDRVQETIDKVPASSALGASPQGNRTVDYNSSRTEKATFTVNLPLSYVDKVNGVVAYKTTADSNQTFTINHKLNKLDTINDFNESKYYNKGERKYYTSIWSEDTNILVIDNEIKLVGQEFGIVPNYNIKVTSSNVGMAKFGSDISCYYGVYSIIETEKGREYIYRPIDLEDVFPNDRDPRWNWTGTLNSSTNKATGAASFANKNSLKYNIDPVSLTKEIESKGYKIYDVQTDPSEIDYEFVLTSENIRNIRDYNKKVRDYNGDGYNNYADYNMSCYKDSKGKEICTSKFLDNISGNSGSETAGNFITYSVSGFNIQARKNLAGCNNSKSGACVEIGS